MNRPEFEADQVDLDAERTLERIGELAKGMFISVRMPKDPPNLSVRAN